MSDLISRRAAIDALWAERMKYAEEMERNLETCSFALRADNKAKRNRVEEDIEIIRQLPSAQPEVLACGEGELTAQQWIPCSERQPEETNLYWVTVKPIDSEMLEVTPRWYFGRGYGDGWEAELYEPPLAWMPMEWPEPWRGEEDGMEG